MIERLSDSDYRDQWDTHCEDLSKIVKDHILRFEERSREVVLAAVKQDGPALVYANTELKNDRDVVLAAVRKNCAALFNVGDELRQEYYFLFDCVNVDPLFSRSYKHYDHGIVVKDMMAVIN